MLLKTLVVGLKNIVWGMSMFRAQAQAQLAANAAAQANPGSTSNLAALNPQVKTNYFLVNGTGSCLQSDC